MYLKYIFRILCLWLQSGALRISPIVSTLFSYSAIYAVYFKVNSEMISLVEKVLKLINNMHTNFYFHPMSKDNQIIF